ncbi:hypothetical protein At12D1_50000 (plasmid) [Agrobacterium tumefaciens]|nr:hypothetical protein At12D1_50000 [Agrobacterium tumefaciens]
MTAAHSGSRRNEIGGWIACTLYSYSPATAQHKQRWHEDGGQRHFYAEAAREAVLRLKREVKRDPEHVWEPMHLEKLEIAVPTTDVLAVLPTKASRRSSKAAESSRPSTTSTNMNAQTTWLWSKRRRAIVLHAKLRRCSNCWSNSGPMMRSRRQPPATAFTIAQPTGLPGESLTWSRFPQPKAQRSDRQRPAERRFSPGPMPAQSSVICPG